MSKTVGVFLARMQPLHNGHIAIIKKMMTENDESIILVGSANKVGKRNPIPIDIRVSLLREAINDMDIAQSKNYKIIKFEDLTDESDNSMAWGTYIYANVVKETRHHTFTMYYSDGYEIITKWFHEFLLRGFVGLMLMPRESTADGMSATKIREAILTNNIDSIKNAVPRCVLNRMNEIVGYVNMSTLIDKNNAERT